ncbi:hypothetical protein INR49_006638 [Caranx melampygus]|nr:hypothetical protein INR49_006638 [Caranx melampygus]
MRRRDASRSQQATGSYGNTHALSHGSEGQCSSERAHSVHSSPASALIRPNIDPRPSVSRPESGSRAGRSASYRRASAASHPCSGCGGACGGGGSSSSWRNVGQQVGAGLRSRTADLSRFVLGNRPTVNICPRKQDPSLKVRARPRVVRTLTFALSERSPHVFTSSSSRKRT